MTEQINQEETSPTEAQFDPVLSIALSGDAVQLLTKPGLTAWQALGLLKTAEAILLGKVNATLSQEG